MFFIYRSEKEAGDKNHRILPRGRERLCLPNVLNKITSVKTLGNACAVYKNSGLHCPLTIEPQR